MKRMLMDELVLWKSNPNKKPLVLNGARQVGKTWLLKEFGTRHFESVAYVSLDNDAVARSYFDMDLDARRIIASLSLQLNMDIVPEKTLIILDEIQACPKAITALKYFCENAPEYAVAAAGSLLGLSAHEGSGFPVGKVNVLDLHPLTFSEFLEATGNGRYAGLIESGDVNLMTPFAPTLEGLLRRYYVVGGMPGAVNAYLAGDDFRAARRVQEELLAGYERDFSKHVPPRLLGRMMLAWASIPRHLSRENKRFVFGQVRKGGRAADFEECLAWLEEAGLIHKVQRVDKPGLPLSAYAEQAIFKVFLLDIGLLGAMCELNPEAILAGSAVFTEFKGALTEQYVCQELIASCGFTPFYWSAENSTGEIDFLVQDGGKIYPIEVKAEENLKAKSLRAFASKYDGVHARRFSMSGYREQDWMRNVPLYAIGHYGLWRADGPR